MQTNAIKLCDPDTPEWLEKREGGIGASDSVSALGLDTERPRRVLYQQKIGEIPGPKDEDFLWFGHQLEPVTLAALTRKMGINVSQHAPGLYQHPDHQFILATPDAFCEDGWLAECKAVSTHSPYNPYRSDEFGDDGTDDIPTKWLIQCQHQMLVMGVEGVHFCVLVGGMDFRYFRVERNEELISRMVPGLAEFWQRIQTRSPPDLEPDQVTLDRIKQIYKTVDDRRTVMLSPEATVAVQQEAAIKEIIKGLEKSRDACKALYLAEMEGARAGVLADQSKMVKRTLVKKKGHVVEPSEYIRSSVVDVDEPARLELERLKLL